MQRLTEAEFQRRLPLWCALTAMFLDTEVTEHDLSYIARTAAATGYSPADVETILFDEVEPVFGPNLLAPLGEWTAWPDSFVAGKMRAWLNRPHGSSALPNAALRRLLREDWMRLERHLPGASAIRC